MNKTLTQKPSKSKITQALELARNKFEVFPVAWSIQQEDGTYRCSCGDENCKHQGKHPLPGSHGFKDASTDPNTIEWWWSETPCANFGIRPNSEQVIIDVDRKNFDKSGELIDGLKSLAEFMNTAEEEILQQTYTVETPTGGFHLYFSCDKDDKFANRAGMLPGIDVRGNDGYVVGPGSMIKNKIYEDFNNLDIKPIPDILRPLMTLARTRDEKAQEPLGELDTPANTRQATTFLKNTNPAIEGQGGNDWTYKTACFVRGIGVSEGKCLELMMVDDGWNSRNETPWDAGELLDVINNAYRYGKDRPGSQSCQERAWVFDCVVGDTNIDVPSHLLNDNEKLDDKVNEPTNPQRFKVLSDSEQDLLKPPKYLVDKIIPENEIGLIVGKSGSGKTFLALDLALHAATGRTWGAGDDFKGFKIKNKMNVLYVAGEDHHSVVTSRKRAWKKANNDPKNISFYSMDGMPRLTEKNEVEAFVKAVESSKCPSPDLIFFDTFVLAMSGADENAAKDVTVLYANCRNLIMKKFHCSIGLIHHEGYGAKRARGSSNIPASVGWNFRVEAEGERLGCDSFLTLHDEKPKNRNKLSKMRFNAIASDNSLVLERASSKSEMAAEVMIEQILRVIPHGELVKTMDMAKQAISSKYSKAQPDTLRKRFDRILKDENKRNEFKDCIKKLGKEEFVFIGQALPD